MVLELIGIAKSDIKAAELLYKKKQYRTSYFFFQQASEKASKAMGIVFGDIKSVKEMRKYSHRMDKMYQEIIKQRREDAKSLNTLMGTHPISNEFAAHVNEYVELLDEYETYEHHFEKIILKGGSYSELNSFLNTLDLLRHSKKQTQLFSNQEIEYAVEKVSAWMSIMAIKQKDIKEVQEIFSDIESIKLFCEEVLKVIVDTTYIASTFAMCTYITANHSESTRYPNNNFNPLTFYSRRNPIVNMQPYFLRHLKFSLNHFEKLATAYNLKSFKNIK